MDYILHIVILISIYGILTNSLNLVAGYSGLLSLAHAAFFGIGAYCAALLTLKAGISFPISLIAAALLTGVLSLLVSIPSFFLRDDFFVVSSFCFQMIVFSVLNNWFDITRGPLGLSGIPNPNFFGWDVTTRADFAILSLLTLAFIVVAIRYGTSGTTGRALRAIREDEVFAQSLGKDTRALKIAAFFMSAQYAAIAGVLYAHYITFIEPSYFTVTESILVLSIVIVGGAGSRWGPLLGTVILVSIPEALRFIGFPAAVAGNLRELIYGVALVLILMFRPGGVINAGDFRGWSGGK